MLVDNKFLYLSLPRCASTAFHYSCILNGVDVQTHNGDWEKANADIDFKKIDKISLMDHIFHGHESLVDLQGKFGIDKPVIAIKRDRHERFYSLYKHVLFDLQRMGYDRYYEKFSKLTIDELFFFTKEDILTKKQRWDIICDFLIRLGLMNEKIDISVISRFWNSEEKKKFKTSAEGYIINIIDILLTPISNWTNNDPNIIWFDFNKMNELEGWVSDKIGREFQLHSANSSKHMGCEIVMNEEFIEKYNSVYDYYDFPKIKKTLI